MQSKLVEKKKEEDAKQPKLSEVKTTDTAQDDLASRIKMPGMPQPGAAEPAKKPLIQVVKKKPTYCEMYNKDNTEMEFIITMEKESSAKDIDL